MRASSFRSPAFLFLALAMALPSAAHAKSERLKFELDDRDHRNCDPTEEWHLADETKFFLQSPPNSLTGLYRTQGMATDGRHWFFSWQLGLEIADRKFNSILRNSSVTPPATIVPGIPLPLLAQGDFAHFRDREALAFIGGFERNTDL